MTIHLSVLTRAIPARRTPDFHAVHTEYHEYHQQALVTQAHVPLMLHCPSRVPLSSKLDIRPQNELNIVFSPARGEFAG